MALDFPGQCSPDIGLANVNIGINNSDLSIDIDAIIASNKTSIRNILNTSSSNEDGFTQNTSFDISLLQGALSFGHSKFTNYIIDFLTIQYNSIYQPRSISDSDLSIFNEKNLLSSKSVGNVLDKVWIEIHHPAIKYFQFAFNHLNKSIKDDSGANSSNKRQNYQSKYSKYNNTNSTNNNNNNSNNNATSTSQLFVEYRKLFDKFIKFIAKAYDFYYNLLRSILNTYDLSIYIPVKKICSTLKINLSSVDENIKDSRLPLPNSNYLVSSIIYLIHKCVLFIGDLSRYRTLIAKTYLPSTSISKEDNNNYSKSIELYKLSLLILPSLGDPYNHIAIIDNLKDDKFNVVYNFIRSSLTSSPLSIAHSNLINLLTKHPRTNSILRKFEHLNSLNRDSITKNDRLGLLKSQFLILFNYNLLPNKWKLKAGYLISGHSITLIENDFYKLLSTLDFHKQIFNDFYFKQMVILTGGFEILIDPNFSKDINSSQSADIISDYLDFLFRYLETFLKVCIKICDDHMTDDGMINTSPCELKIMSFSTSLLPVIRLLICWFNEREIARVYLKNSTKISTLLATLINRIILYIDKDKVQKIFEKLSIKYDLKFSPTSILNQKPIRERLFKEDVALREFKPINYALGDFDDSHLYGKNPESVLALIGELPESQNDETEVETNENKTENDKTENDKNENDKNENEDKGNYRKTGNGTSKENSIGLNVKIRDNLLRLVAIVVSGKELIIKNTHNIKWIDNIIDPQNDDNNNKFRISLGKFDVPNDIDINLPSPYISIDDEPVTHISNTMSSIKDRNNKSNKNTKSKKTNNFNHFDNSVKPAYAGSSFSNFGQPSPESFGKFDKLKRNKSSNKIISRSQTASTISTTSDYNSKKTRDFNNMNYQIQQRPTTSPGFSEKKSTEESQPHSQYVNMVASIVNEENDVIPPDTTDKRLHHDLGDKRSNNGSNDTGHDYNNKGDFNFGNIGITNIKNHDTQHKNTNSINHPGSNKNDSNISESTSSLTNTSYMKYFNQWDSTNNSNISINDKSSQSHCQSKAKLQSQDQNQDQLELQSSPSSKSQSQGDSKDKTNNNHLMNQINQMNIIGSIDSNTSRFSQMNGFYQFGQSIMENPNTNNVHNFNINQMFNDVGKFNLNNNMSSMHNMNPMSNMNSMHNMNSININTLNNFNNINSMNMNMNGISMIDNLPVNMHNIGNMQMNPMNNIPIDMNVNMNIPMDVNLNMNMNLSNLHNNIKNFGPMNPIMSIPNKMNMTNGINDVTLNRTNSRSTFNEDRESQKDKFNPSNNN